MLFNAFTVLTLAIFAENALCNLPRIRRYENNITNCFEKLGCVSSDDPWNFITYSPFTREEASTRFDLFTRRNKEGERLYFDGTGKIASKFFTPYRYTHVIVHGYEDEGTADWIQAMTHALLDRMDVNVIVVDWSTAARSPYLQAVTNTKIVGLEIANMVNAFIEDHDGNAEMFHMIAFSLGAHLAGFAGEKIEGLGRISGLDPAGPLFNGRSTSFRLDSSDAKFVDVIHTDSGNLGYGILIPSGHIDFYPNGGRMQPGFTIPGLTHRLVPQFFIDSTNLRSYHFRSVEYFLESIPSSVLHEKSDNTHCRFVGFLCQSYEDFLERKCFTCGKDMMNCSFMGIDADLSPGMDKPFTKPKKYYLRTKPKAPYCKRNYNYL